jgi:hypothetical protein
MKEFTTAVEDIAIEDEHADALAERERKVRERTATLIGEGLDPIDAEIKAETEEPAVEGAEKPILFKLDGRLMHAYMPTDGQLAFMLASMGRGQTADGRFASIINIMLECLRDDDKDFFESRLLTRDPKKRIPARTIEAVFEYLVEEWFARPTQQPSGSA